MFIVSGRLYSGMGDKNKKFTLCFDDEGLATHCHRVVKSIEEAGQYVEEEEPHKLRERLDEGDIFFFGLQPVVKIVVDEQSHELGDVWLTKTELGKLKMSTE